MKRLLFTYLLVFFSFPLFSQKKDPDYIVSHRPQPPKLVNDFADVLSDKQEEALEEKLVAYDRQTSNQVVIVTVGELGDWPAYDFAATIGEKWKVGNKEFDNGVVLIASFKDPPGKRKTYIGAGYGLINPLNNKVCREIVNAEINPLFKEGQYYRGLDKGVDAIISVIGGKYKAPEGYASRGDTNEELRVVFLVILLIIVVAVIRRRGGGGGMISRRGFGGWYGPTWFGGGGRGWSGGGGSSGGFGGFGGGSFGGGGGGGDW